MCDVYSGILLASFTGHHMGVGGGLGYVMHVVWWVSVHHVQDLLRHPNLNQVLSSGSAALLNLDRTFRIELQFLAAGAYEALALKIDEKILDCFPTKERAITLQQSEKLLRALRQDAMCVCM
jgi:hypothetical protein